MSGVLRNLSVLKDKDLAERITTKMQNAQLVEDELVWEALRDTVEALPQTQVLVLDGFPRTQPQVDLMVASEMFVPTVFELVCSREKALGRIEAAPEDRKGRADDACEIKRTKRQDEFEQFTVPAGNRMKHYGLPWIQLDFEGDNALRNAKLVGDHFGLTEQTTQISLAGI